MSKGKVPKLRFPEFREAGEWEEKPLGQLAKRCTQKNGQGKLNRVLTNSAEFGVVDQRDFFDKDIANQNNLESYFVVEREDYVYNPRISSTAPVGPISKNNIATGVMSPLYTVFRFNNSQNDFYALYFKTTGWHHYMRQASSTGARHDRMAITNDDFMAMPLPVSLPEEQQKIADCLASLDELITLESQKLDTLKTHKKGLMQQLFPTEGETAPKLRFPEFQDAGEWKEKQLQDFSSIIRGASPRPQGDRRYYGGNIPRLMGQDVSRDGKWVTPCIDFLTKRGSELSRLCKKGTLTIICSGDVGVPSFLAVDACIHDGFLALIDINKRLVDEEFLYYCLVNLQRLFNQTATHGGIYTNLTTTILKEFKISIPSIREQKRIADCLAFLDDLITVQTQKLTALKTHKKGLMQQLFPTLVEAIV